MELIRKPEKPETTIISIRVEASVKKELARARDVADQQGIDITAMFTAALADIARSIISSKSKTAMVNGISHESN